MPTVPLEILRHAIGDLLLGDADTLTTGTAAENTNFNFDIELCSLHLASIRPSPAWSLNSADS